MTRMLAVCFASVLFIAVPALSGQGADDARQQRTEEIRLAFDLVLAGANAEPVIRVTEPGLTLTISDPHDTRETYPTIWRESRSLETPPQLRASELGVLPVLNERVRMLRINTGTIVFADAFELDEGTNQVIATGNAVIEVWRDAELVTRATANSVTIGEPEG